jgi:uncharacterized lipoprotein YehR (DUF1307 family)
MKKTLSLTAAILVVAILALSLVSCAPTLSGTYYLGDKKITKTYVELAFSGSKVKISQITVGSVSWETTATYSINEDKITIEIPEDANVLAQAYDGEFTLEEGEDYIKIGALKYTLAE